jgi:hypothetical protein
MRLSTGILVVVAVLGLVGLGLWRFAPSVLVDVQRLLDRETLEVLVARAGLWGPLLIVCLMTVAVVASPRRPFLHHMRIALNGAHLRMFKQLSDHFQRCGKLTSSDAKV